MENKGDSMWDFTLWVRNSLVLALLAAAGYSQAPPPPNIVLILADDQGWVGTSVQLDPSVADSKSDFYKTPALERLAAQGMRFSQAYAPHPNCSPTRLAIQTGKSPAQLHMTDIINRGSGQFYEGLPMIPPQHIDDIPSEEITIAELIKQERPDYVTAHFGKWHLGGGGPGEHGYDEHDGPTTNREGSTPPPNAKRIYGVTERATAFLERQAESGRPFFLQVSHYAVHLPVHAREETVAKYESASKGERHSHPRHAAMTENLDDGLGAVLDKLDELGLGENTWVIYTSDNGSYLAAGEEILTTNRPLAGQKASVWEGGIRVPMIVRGPGVSPAATSAVPTTGMDLYPTIRELLEIEAPLQEGLEGGSLVSVLRGDGQGNVTREREEMVWHFPHYQTIKGTTPQSSIRLGDFKLIKLYETGETKLFNLAEDLGEQNDLSEDDPERAAELENRLVSYLTAIDAHMAKPNPEHAER